MKRSNILWCRLKCMNLSCLLWNSFFFLRKKMITSKQQKKKQSIVQLDQIPVSFKDTNPDFKQTTPMRPQGKIERILNNSCDCVSRCNGSRKLMSKWRKFINHLVLHPHAQGSTELVCIPLPPPLLDYMWQCISWLVDCYTVCNCRTP